MSLAYINPEDFTPFELQKDRLSDETLPICEDSIAGECVKPRDIFLICRTCQHPVKLKVGCGKRFEAICPSCAKKWKSKVRGRYVAGISKMIHPKFVTLTMRYTKGRLSDRLFRLWDYRKYLFKTLARRGYEMRSWCAVVEPPNHIHLVVDMDYIPQYEMAHIWQRITGDSFVVDVRAIPNFKNNLQKISNYIAKYLTKSTHYTRYNLDAFKGFHLVGSWKLQLEIAKRYLECPSCWDILSMGVAHPLDWWVCYYWTHLEAHPPPQG